MRHTCERTIFSSGILANEKRDISSTIKYVPFHHVNYMLSDCKSDKEREESQFIQFERTISKFLFYFDTKITTHM